MSDVRNNLILYFTLGYPDQQTIEAFSELLDGTFVDCVEFGFPSRNPVYDGPRIRETHKVALENFDPEASERIFADLLEKGIKLYSLTYYRDIEHDADRFLEFLREHGFSGLIVPDLLVDYSDDSAAVINRIQQMGLDFIPFFNPATPDSIVREISGKTSSWIYYGLQPSTGINIPFDVGDVTERIRGILPDREINFGFGIRNVEQIRELIGYGANGIAIGSALIDFLQKKNLVGFSGFVSEIRGVLDGS